MAREATMSMGGGERQLKQASEAQQKRLGEAIAKTSESEYKVSQEREAFEAKLKAVTVKAEDVSAIMSQFDLSKPTADRLLRVHGGDLTAALRALVMGPDAA